MIYILKNNRGKYTKKGEWQKAKGERISKFVK